MSRISIPLQAVASPVSQFAAPEVRGNSTAGSTALQLAQALRSIRPEMQNTINSLTEREILSEREKAKADFAQSKWKSMDAWKTAVEKGEVPAQLSGHYVDQLRQEVGRHQVNTAFNQAVSDYDNNAALKGTEDINQVAAFFDERMNAAISQVDPEDVKAVAPVYLARREQFLQQHVANRLQDRPAERRQAAGNELGIIVGGQGPETFDPENPDTSKAEQVRAGVKAWIADKSLTMPNAEVENLLVAKVGETMIAERDGNLGRSVLSNILSSDGKHSMAEVHRVALKDFEDRVKDLEYRDLRLGRQKEEDADKAAYRQASTAFFTQVDELRKANPDLPIDEAIRLSTVKWGALSGPVRQDLESLAAAVRNKTAAEDVRRVMQEHAPKLIDGTLTDDEDVNLITFLAGSGQLDEYTRIQDVLRNRKSLDYVRTDEGLKAEIWQRVSDNNLPLGYLNSLAEKKLISSSDLDTFYRIAIQQQAGQRAESTALTELERLQEQVTAGFVGPDGVRKDDITEEAIRAVNAAKVDYQEAVLALSQEELTPAEKRERLGALRDEIAQKHNGITWDTYKKRQETPALPVPKKPLAPEVKATAKRVYGDLPDKSFETINRDSLDLIAWGMSTKAGPDERNVPPIFNASWLARPQQADAEQPGIESLDKLRIFRQNANDPAQEAALRTDVLMRASVLEYQIEQGKGDFEKLKQQLSELQTNDQAPTIQQKTELIYHVNQLRELALIRSRAGYTPTDAKKQFGNEAWKHVPVFGSETELKKHGPAVLNFFGISDALKAQDFATTQKELIKQMRLNG